MCVDTRVIPVALSEHTHSSHSSHSLTYGVRVWPLALPAVRVRARACVRARARVRVREGITMYVYHLCVWLLPTYVCDHTHKNFTTLDYLSRVPWVFICCFLWLCLRTRFAMDIRLLWWWWCSSCDCLRRPSNSTACDM